MSEFTTTLPSFKDISPLKKDKTLDRVGRIELKPIYLKQKGKESIEGLSFEELSEYYFMRSDYKNAIINFRKFIQKKDTPLNFYFKYALALKCNGDFCEAIIWNEKYLNKSKVGQEVKHVLRLLIWPSVD